jgi:hypothetical protein
MIPKAEEVRLKPKMRKVLEPRGRSPSTAQSQAKRARIVLLAAGGRGTRRSPRKFLFSPHCQQLAAALALPDLRIGRAGARRRSTFTPPTGAFLRFWISRRQQAMRVGHVGEGIGRR